MADIINWEKARAEIRDVNLLSEKGIVKVFYDNDGYLLEVIWFNGYSYFDETDHEDILVMVAMDEDAFGFMVHDADWISEDTEGYVTVNLKSRLEKYANGTSPSGQGTAIAESEWHYNPIERGIINLRYDREAHYCDVFWADGGAGYIETENDNLLALVDNGGILNGFRIINTDGLKENPRGVLSAELKIKMEITQMVQTGDDN